MGRVGVALGEESQANDVQVLLGPGVNMKRSPLGGRNFEYFSEDPVLAGTLAASYIKGVQSQGVGVSLKHFAANNQEFERMKNSSEVDEQTLHEIYLPAFEIAVRESNPWSLMMSYNKINGVYSAENALLMQTILREQWGFEGITISDWGAVNDPVASVEAGLNLEMPGDSAGSRQKIMEAVQSGELAEDTLDKRVGELLGAVFKVHELKRPNVSFDKAGHHALAREAAGESIVLLKNNHVLPLKHPAKSIAIIGAFAKKPRYQGSGSSRVNPTMVDTAYDALHEQLGPEAIAGYALGYKTDGSSTPKLIQQAVDLAQTAETVVIFAGLPGMYESEGFDRTGIGLPEGHDALISAISAVHQRVVVVLMNGSAVAMPWADQVGAIVEGWLGGQAGGSAVADVLTGRVNPSGKLSETFPIRIEDTPPYPDFPGQNGSSYYRDGRFIGYRFYDARKIVPLFPFGHGLSYANFRYDAIALDKQSLGDTEPLTVTVTLSNQGRHIGKEVVQLYLSYENAGHSEPLKALKAFTKVEIPAGATKTLSLTLSSRDFASYDATVHEWRVRPGDYVIRVGGSSADLPLSARVTITSSRPTYPTLTRDSMLKEFAGHPRGKYLYNAIVKQASQNAGATGDDEDTPPLTSMLDDMPLSRLVNLSQGMVSDELVDAFVVYCKHPGSLNPLYAFPLLKPLAKLVMRGLRQKH
jgi:beta-glucosidase